jgi:hypothetical protein
MTNLVSFVDRVRAKATASSSIQMPVWDEKHLRAATDAAGIALWSWNVVGIHRGFGQEQSHLSKSR